jgi:large subunit ribosomal protein L21
MADTKSENKAYAVMVTGGKQHFVRLNDVLEVELLTAKEGDKLEIEPVLALSDGQKLQVGTPVLKGAKVSCTVVKHILGPKLVSYKKNRRMGYHRKVGHRQDLTVLKVDKI